MWVMRRRCVEFGEDGERATWVRKKSIVDIVVVYHHNTNEWTNWIGSDMYVCAYEQWWCLDGFWTISARLVAVVVVVAKNDQFQITSLIGSWIIQPNNCIKCKLQNLFFIFFVAVDSRRDNSVSLCVCMRRSYIQHVRHTISFSIAMVVAATAAAVIDLISRRIA